MLITVGRITSDLCNLNNALSVIISDAAPSPKGARDVSLGVSFRERGRSVRLPSGIRNLQLLDQIVLESRLSLLRHPLALSESSGLQGSLILSSPF